MASLSADELQKQLKVLTMDVNERYKDIGTQGVDKVSQEFLDLRLPIASEILDVSADSGLLSARIQTRGYSFIDALDEDHNTISKLRALRLYRNYICAPVQGPNSTGLASGSYDVIITAGGFNQAKINPNEIRELLRVLREDGLLLWTQHTPEDEKTSEFGLFWRNIESLEKQKICKVIKQERFMDGKNKGIFYMIKRCPIELPAFALDELPKQFEEQVTKIMVDNSDPGDRVTFYDQWSSKYDDDLVVVGNYTGHTKCVEAFLELGLDRSTYIMDLAAGTGLLGAAVTKKGYVQVDAVDSSMGMLNKARQQDIYKNYICATVDHNMGSIPVNDECYDVIMSSSGFAPGQIYPNAIVEILRILRPGGYLIFTMREGYQHRSQQFAMLDDTLQELVKEEKAEIIVGPVIFHNFLLDHDGRFYMLRKPAIHRYALGSPSTTRKISAINKNVKY
jgi:ubiquinone/menaquinone biosynthesis C-methylase UbiE